MNTRKYQQCQTYLAANVQLALATVRQTGERYTFHWHRRTPRTFQLAYLKSLARANGIGWTKRCLLQAPHVRYGQLKPRE
jgi:hypothetical protein